MQFTPDRRDAAPTSSGREGNARPGDQWAFGPLTDVRPLRYVRARSRNPVTGVARLIARFLLKHPVSF